MAGRSLGMLQSPLPQKTWLLLRNLNEVTIMGIYRYIHILTDMVSPI